MTRLLDESFSATATCWDWSAIHGDNTDLNVLSANALQEADTNWALFTASSLTDQTGDDFLYPNNLAPDLSLAGISSDCSVLNAASLTAPTQDSSLITGLYNFGVSDGRELSMTMKAQTRDRNNDVRSVPRPLTHLRDGRPAGNQAARLIASIISAFPQMMLRRQTFPPFIHSFWHRIHLPDTLSNCMAIAHLFSIGSSETQRLLWRTVDQELEKFHNQVSIQN